MLKILFTLVLFCCISPARSQEEPAFPTDHLKVITDRHPVGQTRWTPPEVRSNLDSLIAVCMTEVNQDSLQSYLQSLEDFTTRFMLAPNHRDVADWIRQQFLGMGYLNARLDSFECITEWPAGSGQLDTTWQYNVLASLEGSLNPEIECIVGGHYDAIVYSGGDPFITAPGADDNGSGTAAVLEIARVLKMKGIIPDVTLGFAAWAAEERGLYGSYHHVITSLNEGKNIKTYFNLDMIATEPDTANWKVKLHQYEGCEWIGDLVTTVADNHTGFGIIKDVSNSHGSDSYGFWLAGYPAIFLAEDHYSPNYHMVTDLAVNCNLPYCTEVTRLTLGSLLTAQRIPSMVRYLLYNPGTGNSLIPLWLPNPETNLSAYRVRVGYSEGIYHQTYTTADTFLLLDNLSPDTTYYIAVSAINDQGDEGPINEWSDKPVLVSMDQGILIVDDSEGGIMSPADSVVDQFYDALLADFQHDSYDAYMAQEIGLGDLGRYSSILWHVNTQTSYTVLNRHLYEVAQYLALGGKVLFTLYQPQRVITKYTSYPVEWPEGSFIRDFLGIRVTDLEIASRFNHAITLGAPYQPLFTDSAKTLANINHHLTYIEALHPDTNASTLYLYGTDYDPFTPFGSMFNKPVGVANLNNSFKTVTLSFPLYYMQFEDASNLVRKVMEDAFGETPIGIRAEESPLPVFEVMPNPAGTSTRIRFSLASPAHTEISLFNALGEKMTGVTSGNYPPGIHTLTVNLESLSPGVYFFTMRSGQHNTSRKLVLTGR